MEYVYGVRCGDYVKIGYTTNPMTRMITLPDGVICPDDLDLDQELEMLFLVAGDRETEALLHRLVAYAWVTGEWFRWSKLAPLGDGLSKDIVRLQPKGRAKRSYTPPAQLETDEESSETDAERSARWAREPIDF